MAELSTLGAVIKTAYEGQANTNAFTDAEQAKLAAVDTIASKKSNLTAVVAPTANEDSGDGYAVGSRWVDVTADKEYVCLDATLTAAVWTETTGGGTGSVEGTAVLSTGEAGGTKFLREDGDGTSSWQTVPVGTGDLRADGTVPLTADWDAGSFEIRAQTFESDVATGTAPLVIASTTAVSNLNADLLDGQHAAAFAAAAHAHEGTAILSTGETGGNKFLREDGDNSSSWQGVEGTDILSTGEAGSTKFLNTVGDGTCVWSVALTPLDVPLDNFGAAVAPTVDDDSGDGYTIGSRWINVSTDREYVCFDATLGGAVWKEVTDSLYSNLNAGGAPTVNDDSGDGYAPGSRWINTTDDREYVCFDATLGGALWKEVTNELIQGTAILSTGEAGGTKFLREDGDGTCSWQAVSGTGDFKADGSVDMTGEFRTDVGTMDSDVANGASANAWTFNTANTYSTAGANLLSLQNNGTNVFDFSYQGGIDHVNSGASTAAHSQSLNLNWVAGTTSTSSGQYSAVIGQHNRASGGTAMAFGASNVASGANSIAIGNNSTSSGIGSIAIGERSTSADGSGNVALGYYASHANRSTLAYAGGRFAADGDAQTLIGVYRNSTTDATQTTLVQHGLTYGPVIPADTSWAFSALVVARSDEADGNESAAYKLEGLLIRDESSNTAIVGSVTVTTIAESAGATAWDVTAEADNTNEALAIKVTGEAATNIRWVARVDIAQVTYA